MVSDLVLIIAGNLTFLSDFIKGLPLTTKFVFFLLSLHEETNSKVLNSKTYGFGSLIWNP